MGVPTDGNDRAQNCPGWVINAAASENGLSLPTLSDSDIAKIKTALEDIALGASVPKDIINAAEAQIKKEGKRK